jgi:hypothetical protein
MTAFSTRTEGGKLVITDRNSHETLYPYVPCRWHDDFFGDAIDARWNTVDVSSAGNTTPLIAADVANGILRLPLDVTSEAQESGINWGDQRTLALNQGVVFECRLALQTLPTLLSEMVWGLAGDKNADADTVAESIWFKADGSGAIVVENDDTSHTNDDVATGVTVTAGQYAIYRIDCSTITDVKFYIDGARVASGTTFDMSATPTLALQPYVHSAKASGAGLGVVDVDYIAVWQKRAA